ncbi:MAG: hypothetical protein M3151_02135 [Actinomycetota bacterium]|nr:hypothetical protein [Actinomycetota bacterium]
MSERPEDRPEDRRRTGPLGDDAEETRTGPPAENDPEVTRRVPTQPDQASSETRRIPQGTSQPEDKETRVIRTQGYSDTTGEAAPYPPGYFEAAEDREDRLRDMYGGVDWLASFLGFVFAVVAAALFSLIAGLVLVPLGFPPALGGGEIGAAVITGLALLGLLIFLTFLFGGYVAGRLARFDGGRNGAMLLVWSFVAVLILTLAAGVFSGFLPPGLSDGVGNLLEGVSSTVEDLASAGAVGIAVAIGALLLALLGGFLGGRLGSRYHVQIDRSA